MQNLLGSGVRKVLEERPIREAGEIPTRITAWVAQSFLPTNLGLYRGEFSLGIRLEEDGEGAGMVSRTA